MPILKQLTCHVEWAVADTPLHEYQTSYADGYVETYIALPPQATPFSIHLHSSGYIAPGLAMFVFIDGIYQCNRNRSNLRIPAQASRREQTEVDFRVRQKEERRLDGSLEGKAWKFDRVKIDDTNIDGTATAPYNGEYVGTIEVVVIRCFATTKTEETFNPSTASSSKQREEEDEPLLMGAMFDGTSDPKPKPELVDLDGLSNSTSSSSRRRHRRKHKHKPEKIEIHNSNVRIYNTQDEDDESLHSGRKRRSRHHSERSNSHSHLEVTSPRILLARKQYDRGSNWNRSYEGSDESKKVDLRGGAGDRLWDPVNNPTAKRDALGRIVEEPATSSAAWDPVTNPTVKRNAWGEIISDDNGKGREQGRTATWKDPNDQPSNEHQGANNDASWENKGEGNGSNAWVINSDTGNHNGNDTHGQGDNGWAKSGDDRNDGNNGQDQGAWASGAGNSGNNDTSWGNASGKDDTGTNSWDKDNAQHADQANTWANDIGNGTSNNHGWVTNAANPSGDAAWNSNNTPAEQNDNAWPPAGIDSSNQNVNWDNENNSGGEVTTIVEPEVTLGAATDTSKKGPPRKVSPTAANKGTKSGLSTNNAKSIQPAKTSPPQLSPATKAKNAEAWKNFVPPPWRPKDTATPAAPTSPRTHVPGGWSPPMQPSQPPPPPATATSPAAPPPTLSHPPPVLAATSTIPKPPSKSYWTNWSSPGPLTSAAILPAPLATSKSLTHYVRPQHGGAYRHKLGTPHYMDTPSDPYAIFVFRYRDAAVIEKMVGHPVTIADVDEKQRLRSMSKEELVEEVMKTRASGNGDGRANVQGGGGAIASNWGNGAPLWSAPADHNDGAAHQDNDWGKNPKGAGAWGSTPSAPPGNANATANGGGEGNWGGKENDNDGGGGGGGGGDAPAWAQNGGSDDRNGNSAWNNGNGDDNNNSGGGDNGWDNGNGGAANGNGAEGDANGGNVGWVDSNDQGKSGGTGNGDNAGGDAGWGGSGGNTGW